MAQKLKTYFEEVPLEVAQKIAEEQIAIRPCQATRSEQLRRPTRKLSNKVVKTKQTGVDEREDA